MLELMKALWQPGWTEFEGEFYSAPRREMEPTLYTFPSTSVACPISRYAGLPGTMDGSVT
jgi:hypothetical protein